uniref:Secreted protein n=1 Tax=Steinernema glaseri TaxID=37863 RepID=A0A1I8ADI3_9BILA
MLRRYAQLCSVALLALFWMQATVAHADVINRLRLAFNDESEIRPQERPIYRNSIEDLVKNANMWRKLRSSASYVEPDIEW